MGRSRGSVLLARTAKTQDEIAARVGVSRVAVSKWINGNATPSEGKQAAMLEVFEIPLAAWAEPPTSRPSLPPGNATPPPAVRPPIPADAHSMALELEKMAHDFMTEVRHDTEMSPLEKARVMSALSVTLNHLEKRTGDVGARLFQLPIWKRIEKAIETALEGHPDLAAAVARELRKAENG